MPTMGPEAEIKKPLIEIRDLNINYDGKINILEDINLDISQGELVCVVGPSGAGKSSLLRQILGIEHHQGSIKIDGEEVKGPNVEIGFVPQNYSLFPNYTALENVAHSLFLSRYNFIQNTFFEIRKLLRIKSNIREKIYAEAMSFLSMVNMEKHFDKYPHELSGGQKQRVAIASAIILKPKILLMDEVFSALDPQTKMEIREVLLKLQKEYNLTIFFVTHDIDGDVPALASRLIGLTKYYNGGKHFGARIAFDTANPNINSSLEEEEIIQKSDKWIQELKNDCFVPDVRQDISNFRLTHKDSIKPRAQ